MVARLQAVISRWRPMRWTLLVTLAVLAIGSRLAFAQTPDPVQIEQGARLFADNCAVCHGADGQGRVGATLAKDWPSIRPDLSIRATIMNGIQGSPMPAWGQESGGPFSAAEVDALVAYILTWETGGPRQIPPTPTTIPHPLVSPLPGLQGDPARGAVLFDQNCVVCHGPNGEGRIGATLAKSWASIRPDLSIQNTISQGIAGSPMPAWSQLNGGPLTEAEIADLAAFVLTLPVVASQVSTGMPTPAPAFPAGVPGWSGVILTLVLFVLAVVFAIWIQTRGQKKV